MKRQCTQHNTPSDDGMTLVEMLVVLAIISVAFALALPNLQNTTRTVALHTTALDIKSQLGIARAAAITRNRSVAVIIDLPHRRYASEADGRWISLPADLSVSVTTARGAAGANLARVAFFPDGSSTGGHVFLRRDDLSYDVAVDWLTGQTSVEAAQ